MFVSEATCYCKKVCTGLIMIWELIKLVATVVAVVAGANWVLSSFLLDFLRDWTSVALSQQSNTSSVRKSNETVHYRNFLIPLGFPLTTGLGLSVAYKSRNGNVCDLWNAALEMKEGKNTVRLYPDTSDRTHGKKYTLARINGYVKHIMQSQFMQDTRRVGIATSVDTLPGFVLALASMLRSVKKDASAAHFLSAVPRSQIEGVDVLVIDSWNAFTRLNGSETWYKLVIICGERPSAAQDIPANVSFWDELVNGAVEDSKFEYECPEDMSDDKRELMWVSSPWNDTNCFSQMNLVSSVTSYIKSFPMEHVLKESDNITFAGQLSQPNKTLHIWPKLFSVLLHGGSASFIGESELSIASLKETTLLVVLKSGMEKLLNESMTQKNSIIHKIQEKWANTLLSEGIFTKFAKIRNGALDSLRCIYVENELPNVDIISGLDIKTIKKPTLAAKNTTLTSIQLNEIRTSFGTRAIQEVICPYMIMGTIAATNFFDYRVFPTQVDKLLTCYGTLETNIEGKMVQVEIADNLDITKRQGMLCIRGYNIGKPLEEERLKRAVELSENAGGAEGWMPLVGVFGLFGQDGCLYLYK